MGNSQGLRLETSGRIEVYVNRVQGSLLLAAATISILCFAPSAADAQANPAPHRTVARLQVKAGPDRPLTIRQRPWTITTGLHAGIMMRGNEVYAPGGFSAHHYGIGYASLSATRQALRNAQLRDGADVFLGGYPGLGGLGVSREGGYDNPSYGNTYNRYIGYNGVPSDLAFGPAYGNRYATDHEPTQDEEDDLAPPRNPQQLGFVRSTFVPEPQAE